MQATKILGVGADIKAHVLIEQWDAVWLVEQVEPSTDSDVWLSLLWVAGSTEEGERTTLFFPLDEFVNLFRLTLD